jgi:hypothetical protein
MMLGARARGPLAAVFVLWLGALALAACNEGHKKMASPPFESKSSTPWNELSIPGVELYVEHEDAAPHRSRGSARVDGASARLYGKEAFDAARAKAGDDPTTLATLAMLLLDEDVAGKKPWMAPGGARPPEQQAIARPPARSGDTLVYWREHAQLADLVRCKVTLSTGKLACELGGDVLQAERVGANPADAAKQYLASDNVNDRLRGIEALGKVGDDRAREQLIDMALNKYDWRERQAAVTVLGKLGGAGVTATVSRVLLYDQYPEVRQAAATALGELRDPAGREALERAANGDANGRVQVLAADALKRLK